MTGKKLPLPTITAEQVRLHSTQEDLWMIVYNKVYDVSKFAPLHPGGIEVLLDCAGVDATEAFQDVGHSQDAFDMLLPYLVGELPKAEHQHHAHMLETTGEQDVGEKRRKKKRTSKKTADDRWRRQLLVVALVLLALLALLVVVALQKVQWLKITAY